MSAPSLPPAAPGRYPSLLVTHRNDPNESDGLTMRPTTQILALCLVVAGGAVSNCVAANSSLVKIHAIKALPVEVKEAVASALGKQQKPDYSPPEFVANGAVDVQNSTDKITLVPVISSQDTGALDFMQKCSLIRVSRSGDHLEGLIVDKSASGFADDFEPCSSIAAPHVLDINNDGIEDLLFPTINFNAKGASYRLMDAYLVEDDLTICYSPTASGLFMPFPEEGELKRGALETIVQRSRAVLSKLRCSR